jgi:hypothetical protein
MIALNPLEKAVLEKLLSGEYEPLRVLRSQLADARVERRKNTGVGFFTYLCFANEIRRLEDKRKFIFGDVQATFPGLEGGAGFLVYVIDGALHMLEGFTYEEPWPASLENFGLFYATESERNHLAKMVEVFTRYKQ